MVPLLVVLLFARPEFTRFVVRHWWMVILTMLIGAASGGVGAMLAPKTEAEAWLVVPALPMVIVILAAVLYGLVALMVMFTGA